MASKGFSRSVVGIAAAATVLLAGMATTPTASADDPGYIVLEGDMVVPTDHLDHVPHTSAGPGPDVPAAAGGYALLPGITMDDHHGPGYELVLRSGGDVDELRPEVQEAAAALSSITGGTFTTAAGTTTAEEPERGQLLVMVSATSPCSGTWVGCGGPSGPVPDTDGTGWMWTAGTVWIHPSVLTMTSDDQRGVLFHEIGHALGLGHFDTTFEGRFQVMRSVLGDATLYESGDQNGLLALHPPAPPANDDFASATAIAGASGSSPGDTRWATGEAGEPQHASAGTYRSIWWQWTAPGDGEVAFTAQGATVDPTLALYEGASVAALVPRGSNDDALPGDPGSEVSLQVIGGRTYRIAVDVARGAPGAVELGWSWLAGAPPNDAFGDAAGLLASDGTLLDAVHGSTVGATSQGGEPVHAGDGDGTSIWWRWTAPIDGDLTLDTLGSDGDTVLAAYTGSTVGGLTEVAANDDWPGNGSVSRVQFDVVRGVTYHLAVDAVGPPGAVSLNVGWSPDLPPNDDFPGEVLPSASTSRVGWNVGATLEPLEPQHADTVGGASLWWTWTPPAPGLVTIDTSGTDFLELLAVYTGDALDDLTPVASNNDGGLFSTLVQLRVDPNTTYRIALDGFVGDEGDYQLDLVYSACDHTRFSDVPTENPFCPDITWLAHEGIGSGYADGTFGPRRVVTRQAMAGYLYRAFDSPPGPFDSPSFSDVGAGNVFADQIAWLASSGATTGFDDGTFRPAAPVTRQSAVAFLHRLAGSPAVPPSTDFVDVPLGHPFNGAISWAAATGVVSGYADGRFRPADEVSRQQMSAIIHRHLDD